MKDAAAALRLLAAAAFVLTAAYQVALPATVDFGASLPAALVARGLHGPEDGFRWTSGHGIIDVPGPGPGRTVEVEAAVSAWRPRGTPAPRLRVGAEGVWVEAQPAAPTEVQLVTTTTSRWRGDVEVRLESETFSPGRSDPRLLGVRLHRLRLSSAHGPFAPGRPPLLPVLWALACVQLVFWGGLAAGRPRAARRAGMAAALLLGLGLVVARLWTVRLVPFAVAAEIATILALIALPRPVRLVAAVIGEASGRLARALGALRPAPVLSIAFLAAAGALAAYRLRPVIEIPLGGGRETEKGRRAKQRDDNQGLHGLSSFLAPRDTRGIAGHATGQWRVAVLLPWPHHARSHLRHRW